MLPIPIEDSETPPIQFGQEFVENTWETSCCKLNGRYCIYWCIYMCMVLCTTVQNWHKGSCSEKWSCDPPVWVSEAAPPPHWGWCLHNIIIEYWCLVLHLWQVETSIKLITMSIIALNNINYHDLKVLVLVGDKVCGSLPLISQPSQWNTCSVTTMAMSLLAPDVGLQIDFSV